MKSELQERGVKMVAVLRERYVWYGLTRGLRDCEI
jgi:hypothetical protein